MKKIILAAVAILMAGMFVGCASTPRTSNSNNKNKIFTGVYDENISDVYDDIYWKKNPRDGVARLAINDGKILELRKPSDPDRDIRIQNTFNELINSSEISGRDFMKILGCQQFMQAQSEAGSKTPFFTLRNFLNEQEILPLLLHS